MLFVCSQSFNFTELKPFTPYKLGIMAYNSVGEGPVKTILDVWTEEGGEEAAQLSVEGGVRTVTCTV